MIVSLPFSAPAWPPDTGASRKPTPLRRRRGVDLARDLGRRGRVIDEHRARAHRRERAVGAERDRAHVVVVADAHQHELGVRRRGGRRRRAPCRRTSPTHCAAFAGVRL